MLKDNSSCSVIIVTHNSESYIHETMDCLFRQTVLADHIVIVDCLSANPSYLSRYNLLPNVTLHLAKKNLGFCKGNNLGISLMPKDAKYVLFLNPDAFLTPDFIQNSIQHMQSNVCCGVLSGTLLRYDIKSKKPTGTYDSTGVFPTWYGKWRDRDQGLDFDPQKRTKVENVPALCGALMFCNKAAIQTALLPNGDVFDSKFYMYKEDIDLSCRIRAAGWQLHYCPRLLAYHCRGWQKRSKVPRWLRIMAAKNEVRLHWRLRSPVKLLYSLSKLAAVYLLDI